MPATASPDFSMITTHDMAHQRVERGELVKFYLYPKRFGGTQDEADSRYLPPDVALEKAKFDHMVATRYDDRRVTGYMCQPYDWQNSLVPTAVTLIALRHGTPIFVAKLQVWTPPDTSRTAHT